MSSLSVALPLEISDIDGFVMNKSIRNLAKQNLKMLLLTNPGQRVMVPNFGVGVKTFLFSQNGMEMRSELVSRIYKQVESYMPSLKIVDIKFQDSDLDLDNNVLSMSIEYVLPSINEADLLNITI